MVGRPASLATPQAAPDHDAALQALLDHTASLLAAEYVRLVESAESEPLEAKTAPPPLSRGDDR